MDPLKPRIVTGAQTMLWIALVLWTVELLVFAALGGEVHWAPALVARLLVAGLYVALMRRHNVVRLIVLALALGSIVAVLPGLAAEAEVARVALLLTLAQTGLKAAAAAMLMTRAARAWYSPAVTICARQNRRRCFRAGLVCAPGGRSGKTTPLDARIGQIDHE